jgi:hypothetical protein
MSTFHELQHCITCSAHTYIYRNTTQHSFLIDPWTQHKAVCPQSSFTFRINAHILSHFGYKFTFFFHIQHCVHILSRIGYMFTTFFHIQYTRSHSFTPPLYVHNLL